jgi:hypothetical protein
MYLESAFHILFTILFFLYANYFLFVIVGLEIFSLLISLF